jgi:hypothetical protein
LLNEEANGSGGVNPRQIVNGPGWQAWTDLQRLIILFAALTRPLT